MKKTIAIISTILISSSIQAMAAGPALSEIDLLSSIKSVAKNKSCVSDSDCMTTGVGHKACGGPQQFIVFSKSKTDVKKLSRLIVEYNMLQKRQQQKLGLISTCSVVPRPGTKCQSDTCIPVPPVDGFNPYKVESK